MRRVCPICKEPVTYPAKMYDDLGIDPKLFEGVQLYKGRGCERCKNTGYSGRLAIIEIMTMSDELRKLVLKRSSAMELNKIAVEEGMKTLRMVGLDKAREGVSTLEQVLVTTAAH